MKEKIDLLRAEGHFISDADVVDVVDVFLKSISDKLRFFTSKAYGDVNEVSSAAFKELLRTEVKNAVISFLNGNYESDGIKRYLLACVRGTATRLSNDHKKNVFVCPGCKYLDRYNILEYRNKTFICHSCQNDLNSSEDEEKLNLFQAFAEHSKKGVRCMDCERFIPVPQDDRSVISCPYTDCCFSGKLSELEIMRHPTAKGTVECSIIDQSWNEGGGSSSTNNASTMQSLLSDNMDNHMMEKRDQSNLYFKGSSTGSSLLVEQKIKEHYEILTRVIAEQRGSLAYSSNDSTLIHKALMYDAFTNTIGDYPQEMISYLVHENRNGGLQHKIFQEYVKLLEAKLPFHIKKNGKDYQIKSLLDDNLCIFSGVSEFESKVDVANEIHNETKEIYVGGRKGAYCRPYYFGKLMEVTNVETGISLLENVKEYSFFKILMDDTVAPKTVVNVRHMRIPPHYQMGGMVYLNRIRRKIVDKVYLAIHGKKRELSR